MKSHTVYRTFNTAHRREFVRITEDVADAVREAGVVGGDGFKYHMVDGKHLKVPHTGRVVINVTDPNTGLSATPVTLPFTVYSVLSVTTTSLPNGEQNHSYPSTQLAAVGGSAGSWAPGDTSFELDDPAGIDNVNVEPTAGTLVIRDAQHEYVFAEQ